MEVQHFSHEHALSFYEESEEKFEEVKAPICYGCVQIIEGPSWFCKICANFWLHRSCIELPTEILHPFHSSHRLALLAEPPNYSEFFVCEECGDLSSGFAFHCNICEFNLDIKCAVLNHGDGQRSKGSAETRTEIFHFSHRHDLISFNVREELELKCSACELPLSGPAFGCLNCKFFLHRSCKEMPREIQHPYHPPHLLYAQFGGQGNFCDACDGDAITAIDEIFYICSECNFNLHMQCAKNGIGIRSALKHKCHRHELYSVISSESNEYSHCKVCRKKCKGPCYTCLKCSCTYFHLECIPLPPTVNHESHFHPLTLVDSFLEDDSGEYYCDVCEEKRNPIYPVYCCKECPDYIPFIAHIECLVSELTDVELDPGSASSSNVVDNVLVAQPAKHNEEQLGDTKYPAFAEFNEAISKPQCKKQIEVKIKDFSIDHILIFEEEMSMSDDIHTCYACKIMIIGSGYTCQICQIPLHKLCAELPHKIRHPLHSTHTLSLFPPYHPRAPAFICDVCRRVNKGMACYQCEECRFILDLNCASLADDQCQKSNVHSRVIKISHFTHKHKLTLANSNEEKRYNCRACTLLILGSTYCCLDCNFFLHESCIEILQEIQHPYHPQHSFLFKDLDGIPKQCRACKLKISDLAYSCDECEFFLHFTCANYPTSTLKHMCHEHELFCFSTFDLTNDGFRQLRYSHDNECNFQCQACGENSKDCFYRCVQCDLNLHLKCIPIPLKLKQECHLDPLVLYENLVEDDSGEYYCDICEKPRNPNHDVYYCEECEVVIAHIGCVIWEGDPSLEALLWWSDDDPGSDIVETSGQVDPGTVLGSDASGSASKQDRDVGDSEQVKEATDSEQNDGTMKECNAEVGRYHTIVQPEEAIKDLREETSKLTAGED